MTNEQAVANVQHYAFDKAGVQSSPRGSWWKLNEQFFDDAKEADNLRFVSAGVDRDHKVARDLTCIDDGTGVGGFPRLLQ